jgi:hypothetical protein
MRIRKKHFIIGGVILVGLLSVFAVLAASGPPPFCKGGFHHGWHGTNIHSRHFGRDLSEHILERLDYGADQLGLSDSQREEYEEVRQRIESHLLEVMERRSAFIQELQSEMGREDPDLIRLATRLKERIREMPDFMEDHVDLFVELYNILDEDQKTRFVNMIRERMESRSAQ